MAFTLEAFLYRFYYSLVKSPVNVHCGSAVAAALWGTPLEQGKNLVSESQSCERGQYARSLVLAIYTQVSRGRSGIGVEERGKLFQPESFLKVQAL